MTAYEQQYDVYLKEIQAALENACDTYLPEDSRVCQAARYSLMGGGKRIRAVLTLACCDMLGGDWRAAAHFAAAVEMLHCFSLIHDDLPCMDNDDFRRGKPSCHKAFDEATALLAGDVLLTEAFEVIANAPLSEHARIEAARLLAVGGGSRGMIWGQELDVTYEGKPLDEALLRTIHKNKTGALINASVQMGVCAAGGTREDASYLERYAFDLGLVFQIVDDVLDVISTPEELGKPIGSDQENGKVTFATLYGPQGALELAQKINDESCEALKKVYGDRADFLIHLAGQLVTRRK
ncbi:polyprenyl synthetase family protein [Allofournierella massiliensis]|uniref:Farnesyl diphosphate synthase n=1 Tax=Allofournierella massiliensis TaxID=1650663 RepID=A0A4R1R0C9_9FIRM|nr:farnesyl diphosphate synthase [Fournierella massiliensis]TCL58753.1 farnesyl diphosphate synthase/geranylgeranyl diphosphate synthase type II [Fournierella massiliensis]